MANASWLISWIGKTDHDAAEGKGKGDIGPIASALLGEVRYDRIYLLTNYEFKQSQRYCDWLEQKTGYKSSAVDLYGVDLTSPIDYASIYSGVTKNLKQAGLPRDGIELTFHLRAREFFGYADGIDSARCPSFARELEDSNRADFRSSERRCIH